MDRGEMDAITTALLGNATAAASTLLLLTSTALMITLLVVTRPTPTRRRPAFVTWLILPWLLHATAYYAATLGLRLAGVTIGDMPITLYVTLWSTGLRVHVLLIVTVLVIDYVRQGRVV